MSSRTAVVAMLLVLVGSPAYAYVDPGAVGLLTQIGYALVLGLLSGVMLFAGRLKKLFSFGSKAGKGKGDSQQ